MTKSQAGKYISHHFTGINADAVATTIHCCAVGPLEIYPPLAARICKVSNDSHFEKNISIDSVEAKYDGWQGESIAAATFKQRYFEYTLGWDFDTVWVWNDEKNRPALRQVGVQATVAAPTQPAADPNTVDLLTQQVQANIWL